MHGRVDDIQFIEIGLFGSFSSIISFGELTYTNLLPITKEILCIKCTNLWTFPIFAIIACI